ncbi:hypothetical protein SVIO_003280 [Streptomyces violaceusniger]|uniref:Uncharacterized protein n=1 Tax=Streptomyces violaceusniger TaxID=68280 RepID=A0A4D4KL67_STRVO|nr:hypothetical protein SVIO_003280 [Streptomyces violaceusniger]
MTVADGSVSPDSSLVHAGVEFHAFAGSPDVVARHLYGLPRDLVEGTLWALILSGAERAHVQIQERAALGDSRARVFAWEGTVLGTLPAGIAAALSGHPMPPRSHEALRDVLFRHGDYTDLGVVPCPRTARGAFGHPMRWFAGEQSVYALVLSF